MRAPRSHIRIASLVLVVGATMVGLGSAPRAQVPGANAALNAKQRLLAGEPLPVNLAADVKARRNWPPARRVPVYAPGRVVVKLADGATASTLDALSVHAGAPALVRPAHGDFVVLALAPGADVVAAAAELAAQPGVVYAEPDRLAYLSYVPNDPAATTCNGTFKKLGMERAWDVNHGGQSVTHGGRHRLEESHTLTSATSDRRPIWREPTSCRPTTSSGTTTTPTDLDGHGTHVTGTIGERTGNDLGVAGMAFNVSLMPVKAVSGVWDEALGAPNHRDGEHRWPRPSATRRTTAPRSST